MGTGEERGTNVIILPGPRDMVAGRELRERGFRVRALLRGSLEYQAKDAESEKLHGHRARWNIKAAGGLCETTGSLPCKPVMHLARCLRAWEH